MSWSSDNTIDDEFEKALQRKLEDDEILIGEKHPLMYAFPILVKLVEIGIVKVYINKKRTFVCKHSGVTKSVKDRWEEVKFFLNHVKKLKYIDKNESEYFEVIKLAL